MNTTVETDMIKECRSCIFIVLCFTLPEDGGWQPKHAGPTKKLYVKMFVFFNV